MSIVTDIKPLKNWDVSNVTNFSHLFSDCNLKDIKPLKNGIFQRGKILNLYSCTLLKDIKPLKKLIISKGEHFKSMFKNCTLLSDINPLKNWDRKRF